jgi:hypothetical protein
MALGVIGFTGVSFRILEPSVKLDFGFFSGFRASAFALLRRIDFQRTLSILGLLKNFRGGREIFLAFIDVLKNTLLVSTSKHADWRADLDASRDVSEPDKQGYGLLRKHSD